MPILIIILSLSLSLTIGCRESKPEDTAEPPPSPAGAAPEPVRELERIETGLQLSRGVVLQHGEGPPHLVAANFFKGELLNIGDHPDPQKLTLSPKPVRGFYALKKDALLALETGGTRLFRVSLRPEGLQLDAALEVCNRPRLAAVAADQNVAWVVCRDKDATLVRVTLSPFAVAEKRSISGILADVAALPDKNRLLYTDLSDNSLHILNLSSGAEIRSLTLPPEPVRIVTAPASTAISSPQPEAQRVWITHANSDIISAIKPDLSEVERSVELGIIPSEVVPSPNGLYLYILSAGSGRLLVVSTSTMSILQRSEVPVGSSSLVWFGGQSDGSLLMSSGPRGHLWVWRAASDRLSTPQRLSVGAATGHISIGRGQDSVWITCPQAGRSVRFLVP